MQTITPYLWYDGRAEEAARFYVSVFDDARIKRLTHLPAGPAAGAAMVEFELQGQEFLAIDGGPQFPFTPAISLFVNCEQQGEVDALWQRLGDGGEAGQCGWLTDRFGVSWQIVPRLLRELIADPDPDKSARVMQAMLQMGKLEIDGLRRAHLEPR